MDPKLTLFRTFSALLKTSQISSGSEVDEVMIFNFNWKEILRFAQR
jgi:hypothetical protein